MEHQITQQIDELEKISIEIRKELLKIRCSNSIRLNSLKSCSDSFKSIIDQINISQASS